jgi:excisionase family DNA binding protein
VGNVVIIRHMGKKPPGPELPITAAEAARILGLSPQQVRTHAREGRLKAVRVGRDWLFARTDVESFTPAPRGWKKGRKRKTDSPED